MTHAPSQPMDVHIGAVGACTSIGACFLSTAAAMRAGLSTFAEHPYMVDAIGAPMVVARAPYLPEGMVGADRLWAMADLALEEVLKPLEGSHREAIAPIPMCLGLPPGRPGRALSLGQDFHARLEPSGHAVARNADFYVVETGHAAGLMALDAACDWIESGRAELCLAGGVDGYLDPETLEWLESRGQLHGAGKRRNPWGFIPGEAACFCLLGRRSVLESRGLSSLARVVAVATSQEAHRIKTDGVCLGEGSTEAFRRVMSHLPPSTRIDHLICDMNGEAYRADELGFALARTSEFFHQPERFQMPVEGWGDVGAASGPLFAGLVVAAAQRGYGKGPYTLLCASSESGERSAAILHADIHRR